MAGSNLFSVVTSTLDIALTDKSDKAVFAKSQGTPPTTADTFSIGCICIDVTNAIIYLNIGTVAVPEWATVTAAVV